MNNYNLYKQTSLDKESPNCIAAYSPMLLLLNIYEIKRRKKYFTLNNC